MECKIFFFYTRTICNFLVNNFSTFSLLFFFFDFFPNFSSFSKLFFKLLKLFLVSIFYMYIHVFAFLFHGLRGLGPKGGALSQLVTGCVTCRTSHGCVTHFRPIFGNLVEVTLVTSPFMYIVSHAKGTSFP